MSSFTIESVKAREILDSRGNPTVEVDLKLKGGACGRAAVPSGASTGSREALELRDPNKQRYVGKGVTVACGKVNQEIANTVRGNCFDTQKALDDALLKLDGTPNKSKLGANSILGVSMAFARAIANSQSEPLYQSLKQSFQEVGGKPREDGNLLPVPLMNIVNGGAHAHNGLDFQEFMIIPAGTTSFKESLRMGVEVFHHLKSILKSEGLGTTVGDEGGFAPSFDDYEEKHEQVLEFIMQAIESAGYKAGHDIYLGLDVAASEFFDADRYTFEGRPRSSQDMIGVYQKMVDQYPIISIEDGLSEKDWSGWKLLTSSLGEKVQMVGDDIFVTNPSILKEGISENIGNSILVKLNQIGTVSETLSAIRMAHEASYTTIISHRSGETEDSFIADLAVAVGAGQIKTGSASRSDRTAKYNQLLRIEEELGSKARFLGLKSFSNLIF